MLETRPYQTRIVERALKAVEDSHRNVLLESACGSGKTIMAHLIAKGLYERYGWKTGWTAMRRHLLSQAESDNHRLLGFSHIRYFSLFDKNPPTDIDVLILDEAHHSASETATTLYQRIKPKLFLGCTATPYRTDRMKLCFSRIIRDAGIRQLIDSGWLAPFHQYVYDGDWTPQKVAGLYLAQPDHWGKTVVYFLTLAECYECAQILRSTGVPCEVVHGSSDQEAQIGAFERGEVPVLLNVVVLTEGFDCTALKTVFCRPGSKGPTIQMAGRALRRHPGKPYAQIVQNGRTHWPFTKVASAEAKYILHKGEWRTRREETGKVRIASANAILEIPKIAVRMPKYLTKRRRRRRRIFPGAGVGAGVGEGAMEGIA